MTDNHADDKNKAHNRTEKNVSLECAVLAKHRRLKSVDLYPITSLSECHYIVALTIAPIKHNQKKINTIIQKN